jgi:hypothetical protein
MTDPATERALSRVIIETDTATVTEALEAAERALADVKNALIQQRSVYQRLRRIAASSGIVFGGFLIALDLGAGAYHINGYWDELQFIWWFAVGVALVFQGWRVS